MDITPILDPTTPKKRTKKTDETPVEKPKRRIVSKIKNKDKYHEIFPIKWHRNNYVCYICEMVMTNFDIFTNHLNVHSNENIKEVYHNIRKGAKFYHGDGKIKCRRCSMTVNSLEDVKEHMFMLHNTKYLKTAPTLKEKIKLLKKEKKEKPLDVYPMKWRNNCFTCIVCDLDLLDMDEIKRHIIVHTPNEIRNKFCRIRRARKLLYKAPNLCCRTCNAVLNDFNDIKAHISKEHNKNVTSRRSKSGVEPATNKASYIVDKDALDCPICGEKFMYNANLNMHMNIHFPNYICETCGKAFATEVRVKAHSRTHLLGEFPCPKCEKVFNTVTKRQQHLLVIHRGGTNFYCPKCPMVTRSLYSRIKHLSVIHGEEFRKYQCKLCPKKFVTPGQRAGHVRRDHIKERNFKCEKCGLAFYGKSTLVRHMIKHGGAKIHSCKICEKSYQRKSTLQEHMKIHDAFKKHVCNVCGRGFTQKCTLNGHLKVHEKHGGV